MYHGLTEKPKSQDWTQVTVDDFRDHMRYLKDNYRPVSLKEIAGTLETGPGEPHSVAVTFDDGYKSNYDLAYPILENLGIPATMFITSGFVLPHDENRRYLWPDFITILLNSYSGVALDLKEIGFPQYVLSSYRNICSAKDDICRNLKSTSCTEKDNIITSLYVKYGDIIDHKRFADYWPMSPDQLQQLASCELITIGAHSRNHPILSRLEPDRLEDEIVGSKRDLEEITGTDVSEFAYPNGRWCDINREVVDITARHFECAVMTEAGLNFIGHNKYLLRRIGIGSNLDFRQYRAMLSGVYYFGQKPIVRFEKAGK